ncbi:MAG: COR domain-containing protein [Saprospiraceae bacterium]
MSQLALVLIRQAKEKRLTKLDLGNCGLMTLPKELFELTWLEELILCSAGSIYDIEKKELTFFKSQNRGAPNNIIHISSLIKSLKNLKVLFANGWGEKWELDDLNSLRGLPQLKKLYISETYVTDLSGLEDLIELEELDVSSTLVDNLSPVKDLTQLQILSASSTLVSDLGPIKGLSKLEMLFISSTSVGDLSPLEKLYRLQVLYIYSTNVSDLGPLRGLTQLRVLSVGSTQVSDLSPLKELVKLQTLSVSSTPVSDLTPLKDLTQLQVFYVYLTHVSDLTPLKDLTQLQLFSVYSTRVSDLTPLENLLQLKELDISATSVSNLNPLKKLIKSGVLIKFSRGEYVINVEDCPLDTSLIAAIKKGQSAVLNYLNRPKSRLFESRVLVLGEPRAGKTTLRRKLKNPNAEMPKLTESTKAFEIEIEPYKCKVEKDGEIYKITYHLWDFGGQDDYRLLHQLFVAEQSVYVIVTGTDANNYEEELDFWLETIQRLGKDKNGKYGPVILFQNPKNKREDLNFFELKKRYPFWQQPEQFIVNLNAIGRNKSHELPHNFDRKELERFKHFKDYLQRSFYQVEHIGKEMPEAWIRIKKELDKKRLKNWMSIEDFRKNCNKKGIEKIEEQDNLLDIFRTLGFLFHYKGGALEGMVILNSEWITDALYRVFDDKILDTNKGWFVEADVKKIWHEPKYLNRTQSLLDLMQEFKLSYFNKESQRYIVPAKLPRDTEGLPEWDNRKNVRLRLKYDWLPRAIATQLVVSLHEHIIPIENGKQWIWRRGAVLDGRNLELKNVQVRIQDNWKENRIDITARGEFSEMLIRMVIHKWREINAPFEDKVVVTKIILCSCRDCQKSEEPHKFEYENVLNAKELGKKLQCNKSFEEYNAADILQGIFDESTVAVDAFSKRDGRMNTKILSFIAGSGLGKVIEILPDNEWGNSLKKQYWDLKKAFELELISYQDFDRTQGQIVANLLLYEESESIKFFEGIKIPQDTYKEHSERPVVYNFGQMFVTDSIDNIAYTQQLGISKADFDALKQQIEQLSTEKRAALQDEITSIPLPSNEAEKLSAGKRILNWFNQNSEGIAVNVSASVYFDVMKAFFGL